MKRGNLKSWQFKFVKLQPPSHQIATQKEFEQLGKDGWELAATYSTNCGNHVNSVAIFKKISDNASSV